VVLTGLATAAIGGQLAVAKDMQGWMRAAHIALAGLTVVSSWAFIQVMMSRCTTRTSTTWPWRATSRRACGSREDERPTYGDFFHFSAVIGTSGRRPMCPS
jgi:uncharacterized membrane protein